jgi:hypothetical protein
MADPKVPVPIIDPTNYLSDAVDSLKRVVQDIFADGFRVGYAQAKEDANRAWGGISPNGENLAEDDSSADDMRGAATHRLIESVLRKQAMATPADIFESPQNPNGEISRQAIGKALRRSAHGRDRRYIDHGEGRYGLAAGRN